MGIKSNNLAAIYHDFFSRSGKDAVGAAPSISSFQASGGDIANGVQPGNGWTYHVFTQPGNFTVSNGSATVQYVVIGGGGGGGNEDVGGGGGAGAFIAGSTTVSASQPITIGQGGAGSDQPNPAPNGRGANGGDTIFGSITANGGGGGGSGNYQQPNKPGNANGNASGGGGGWRLGAGGAGGAYGYAGGDGNSNGSGSTNAGGGGGAGGVGETMPSPASHSRSAAGGPGAPAGPGYDSSLPAFAPMPATWKSVVGSTGLFAGGGGGGADGGPDTTAPAPGGGGVGDSGGCFGPDRRATQGLDNTGSGGGGGGGCSSANYPGQPGGDGIIILRHQGNQITGGYTTRGIIFDYDPGLLSFSDGTTLNSSSVLEGGLVSGNNQANTTVDCSNGSLTYKTANGGYISGESSTGLMLAGGVALQQALDACQSITLTCWFYHPGDARHALMSRYGTGWTNQFNHFIDPGQELHYNYTGAIANSAADINTSVFSANTWTLSHNTYDVSTGIARWYMNGQEVATANLGTDGGNGLTVSSSFSGQGFGWLSRADYYQSNDGRMGKVRIHNVALSASECLYDFNQQKGIYGL